MHQRPKCRGLMMSRSLSPLWIAGLMLVAFLAMTGEAVPQQQEDEAPEEQDEAPAEQVEPLAEQEEPLAEQEEPPAENPNLLELYPETISPPRSEEETPPDQEVSPPEPEPQPPEPTLSEPAPADPPRDVAVGSEVDTPPSTFPWIVVVVVVVIVLVVAGWFIVKPRPPAGSLEQPPEDLSTTDPEGLIELFLTYRDLQDWPRMDSVYQAMPESVRQRSVVRQQRAFALNRAGDGEAAERLLREQMAQEGVSAETCGILGRVFKDRWEAARGAGDETRAREMHAEALRQYLTGHEADPSNPYPGVNALTLMELASSPSARRDTLAAEVGQAVAARVASPAPSYWDHASNLEHAILLDDEERATSALAAALAAPRTPWQVETTRRNLRLLLESRERTGGTASPAWAREIEERLAG